MNTPAFFGPQFVVNTTTAGHQFDPAVTGLANGKFVAVWADNAFQSNDFGPIRAQLYNADGSKLGGEFVTNQNALNPSVAPALTALADGRFVVAWSDISGGNSEGFARARVFNADGTAAGDEFGLSNVIANGQNVPTLTSLTDGGFAATWTLNGDIRGRIFDADGTPRSVEFTVDEGPSLEVFSTVAGLANGNLVVVWQDNGGEPNETDGSKSHIRARLVAPDGTFLGGEFIVNSFAPDSQTHPTVTALAGGGFAVAWEHEFSPTDLDIRMRLFDANGVPRGADFAIDETAEVNETAPSITALPDGNLFIAWTDAGGGGESDGSLSHVRAKVISGVNGLSLTDEFIVNSTVVEDQQSPTVTVLADGRVVVAWEDLSNLFSSSTLFDATDVRAQIIDPRLAAVTLAGSNAGDDWVGTGFADTMDGKGGNDVLNGGAGADTMKGGLGNDVYTVDDTGDVVTEAANQGVDIVNTTLNSFTLKANVERVNFVGSGNFVGAGNELDNRFAGGAGGDRFVTSAGADIYGGGGGVDAVDYRTATTGAVLNFATGAFAGAAAGDSFGSIEKFFGSSTAADTMVGSSAGNFVFAGFGGADKLTGGAKIDQLLGGDGNDILSGLAGKDTLIGEAGNDTMTGGADGDVFVYAVAGFGKDQITDWQDGLDRFKVADAVADAFADFKVTGNGTTDVTLSLVGDPTQTITLHGASAISISAADFVFV